MRIFVLLVLVSLTSCQSKKAPATPNILIFLTDDMGYSDLNCYNGIAKTPNLDALAANGVKFTHCYSGAPNCSPARVSLLTGRMPIRTGMYSYRPPAHVMHLKGEEVTLAEVLKPAGYQTAHFGKWHLGCLPQDPALNQPQPDQQGFDYSFGTANNAIPSHFRPTNFIRNGKAVGELEGYACQLVADEVDLWFKEVYSEDHPFFLYVAFNEPHKKVASPPEMIRHYPEHKPQIAEYFANIENMDDAVGRILSRLKAKGLYENTMIFFTSDNGSYRMGSNDPLRGLKGEVYDGGIKVPGIFSYPKVFPGKRELDEPIWFPDLLPTISNLVNVDLPTGIHYDGINLLPLLKGDGQIQRTQPMMWFFYRSDPELAMRDGDHMLIARAHDTIPRTHFLADIDMPYLKNWQPAFFELYDVQKDPGQQWDLSGEEPEKLDRLKTKFNTLFAAARSEGPFWEGLPAYNLKKANHNKPFEYLRNQNRFLKARKNTSTAE